MLVVVDGADRRRARRRGRASSPTGSARCRPTLVESVDDDDAEARAFFKRAPPPVRRRSPISSARATRCAAGSTPRSSRANPLYIDLDDDDAATPSRATSSSSTSCARSARDAEAKLDRARPTSAPTARSAMIQIAHRVPRDRRRPRRASWSRELDAIARARSSPTHPGVDDRLHRRRRSPRSPSTTRSSRAWCCRASITTLLVALVLALYFRSATLLVLLDRHARDRDRRRVRRRRAHRRPPQRGDRVPRRDHRRQRRQLRHPADRALPRGAPHAATSTSALAVAIVGTLRPTAVASLGASIAYGSLAATSFRGFADFAVIGAVGMIAVLDRDVRAAARAGAAVRPRARASTARDPLVGSHRSSRVFGFRRPRVVVRRRASCVAVARDRDRRRATSRTIRSSTTSRSCARRAPTRSTARDWMAAVRPALRPRHLRAARTSPPTGSIRCR